MLSGGLTILQDQLIQAALQSLWVKTTFPCPTPTLNPFKPAKPTATEGNATLPTLLWATLSKYLQNLRDEKGLSSEEIVQKYVYITAGGCGPCRFGMYITEYKKALRDAGFDGFRITSFEHDKGIFQGDDIDDEILQFTPKFFITLIKSVIIGDIINLLGYKMRPYELEAGSTDKAIEACRVLVSNAFLEKKSLIKALWKCREVLEKVKLDRLQPKAKVMVMGEFWAAMTEGDGNYNLHRFLEAEGAECIPQPIINRLMLSIWEAERALHKNENLHVEDAKKIDFQQRQKKSAHQTGQNSHQNPFWSLRQSHRTT